MLGFYLLVGYASAEIFTSHLHMRRVSETREHIIDLVEKYTAAERKRIDDITTILNQIRSESKPIGNVDDFMGNPINQIRLIKHLTVDLQKIHALVNDRGFADRLLNSITSANVPDDEDMRGALDGLFRIQDTYALSPDFFLRGNASSRHSARPMTWQECFQIGRIAYSRKDYDHSYDWFRSAFAMFPSSGDVNVTEKLDIADHLSFVSHMIGLEDQALQFTDLMLEIDPKHQRAALNRKYFIRELDRRGRNISASANSTVTTVPRRKREMNDYEQLCAGIGGMNDSARLATMHCSLVTNERPRLVLQPVKQEIVFDRPKIILFHDIISDKDIEFLEKASEKKLKRATVRSAATNQYVPADYRVSKSSWFDDDFHPIVRRLSQLISDLTNLTMGTAEELQVQNYGVGGHYEPHYDFSRKSEKTFFENGNRVATWLTYMSDVEMGGYTVYPLVGARLKPKKGSAAFWFNLHRSGSGDYTTRHASCPVIMGSKWVANKWVHEKDQEFMRPCAKDPML